MIRRPSSRPRAGPIRSILVRLLAVVFILALAAVPLPFAALGAALARRPERRTDAVVFLLRRRHRRQPAAARRLIVARRD